MKKSRLEKAGVCSIIVLFVGTTLVPGMYGINDNQDNFDTSFEMSKPMDFVPFSNKAVGSSEYREYDILQNNNGAKSRADSELDWLWAVSAGGTSGDYGWGVAVDTLGNVYFTGHFMGTATFGTTTLVSVGYRDVYVAKLDTHGIWQWAVSAGGPSDDYGQAIAVDASGNVYITGDFWGYATFGTTTLVGNGEEVYVAKLNTAGVWQWAVSAGGTYWDRGRAVALDALGNICITGHFQGTAMFGTTTIVSQGQWDVFVAKLNTTGVWQWAVSAGGVSYDYGESVSVDPSGNVYITGFFSGSATFGSTTLVSQGGYDVFVAKLTTTGAWQWAVRAGGTSNDYGRGVAVDASGSVYITGQFEGTVLFGTTTLVSQGVYDVFLAKLTTTGAWQWAVRAGGTSDDFGQAVAVDTFGNVSITGHFTGTATFGTTTLVSQGNKDVFVAQLNATGAWQHAVSAGGPIDDFGQAVAVDTLGNIYITGHFQQTAIFGTTTLVSQGIRDVFVAKLSTGGNQPPYYPSNPNPVNGSVNIDINAVLSWAGGDPDPGDNVTYDVYFGTSSTPPKVVSNQSDTVYNPGVMQYSTLYYWRIVAWDDHNASSIGPVWRFTTKNNKPPVFGTPSPTNGSTSQPLNLTWSIPISDPEGDVFSWTIQCSNGQTNSGTGESNGTKSLALSSLAYTTTYKVWVNASDPDGSGLYTRRWYVFTTKANQPPYPPTITGPATGKIKVAINYNFTTIDIDGDMVYYFIDWGDGTNSSWIGPYASGDVITQSHTWSIKGNYIIGAKVKDTIGSESAWAYLEVTMPKNSAFMFNFFLQRLFEQFPHAFPILRHLLRY